MRAADDLERVVEQPELAQFVRIVLGVDWLGDTRTYKTAQDRQSKRLLLWAGLCASRRLC